MAVASKIGWMVINLRNCPIKQQFSWELPGARVLIVSAVSVLSQSAGLGRFDVAAATGIFPLLPVSVGCSKKRPIFGPLRALVPLRVACWLGLQP